MDATALNEQYLPGNTCFGCGPANEHGLRIRVFRDGGHDDRLIGTLRARESHGGFPQIVHGGLQFAALDCMAAWIAFVLRGQARMMPMTRSASMRYERPALIHEPIALAARIVQEAATPRDPMLIRSDLRNARGELLSEGDFEYVLVPPDRFKKLVGVETLPESYRHHFPNG